MDEAYRGKISLIAAPVEVILGIYNELDKPSDIVSFASTCRHLRSIWDAHKDSILLAAAQKTIDAFEEGLLTIRVTNLAKEYIMNSYSRSYNIYKFENESLSGVHPRDIGAKLPPLPKPQIDLKLLRNHSAKPTFAEIQSVYDLFTLVSCALKLGGTRPAEDFGGIGKHLEDLASPHDHPIIYAESLVYNILPTMEKAKSNERDYKIHRHRVYSSMYRVFTAGAFLAPAYWEPFFSGEEDVVPLLQKLGKGNISFTRKDRDFLKRYTPYNIKNLPPKAVDAVYKPLLDYLLDSGRQEVLVDTKTLLDDGIDLDLPESCIIEKYRETSALHQVLMLFLAQEILRRLFANDDYLNLGSGQENLMNYCSVDAGCNSRIPLPTKEHAADFAARRGEFTGYRSLELIMFGLFDLERFSFPGKASDTTPETWLVVQGTVKNEDGKYRRMIPDFDHLVSMFEWETKHEFGGTYEPWAEADFFIWGLKKLGLKFQRLWFDTTGEYSQGDYFFEGELFWAINECHRGEVVTAINVDRSENEDED